MVWTQVKPYREPDFVINLSFVEREIGLILPRLSFWLLVFQRLFLFTFPAVLLGAFIYKFIVPNRRSNYASIVGYGVVVPVSLMIPFFIENLMETEMNFFPLVNGCYFFGCAFKCSEAINGFSPPGAEASLRNYLVYFCNPIEVIFDPKTSEFLACTRSKVTSRVIECASSLAFASLFLSLLSPRSSYAFFDLAGSSRTTDYDVSTPFEIMLIFAKHSANIILIGVALSHVLAAFTRSFIALVSCFLGIEVIDASSNPFFASRSPSDFWGKRWNNIVHRLLKRAVYKPIRGMFPSNVAVFVTFLVSGLFHEYLLVLIDYARRRNNDAFGDKVEHEWNIQFGNHGLFFLWNAVLLILESRTSSWKIFGAIKSTFPTYVVSILVICTALPVIPLFTDEYVQMGIFDDFLSAIPIFILI